jgi:hypothetical protein
MVGWFGKDWGAPICKEGIQWATPVGQACPACEVAITAEDNGLMIEHLGVKAVQVRPWHLACFARDIGIAPREGDFK